MRSVKPTISEGFAMIEAMRSGSDTPKWYGQPVRDMLSMFGDVPLDDVTPEDIRRWWRDVLTRGVSQATANSYARAMRAYWNHMTRLRHVDASPAANIQPPPLPPKKPKDISDEDVAKLVKKAKRNLRDVAIILMLRDTGARVGGLLSMTVEGVDVSSAKGEFFGRALVTEKGGKSRFVYFKHDAATALLEYMEARPVFAPPALWLSNSDAPLSRSGVYHMLRTTAMRAGVSRFNPHAFRHRLAKKLVANGAPTKVIQDIMGWTSPRMVDNYVSHTVDELQAFHSRYAP